jgi:subtilisin family serine protease
VALACLSISFASFELQAKSIRLRNETISTAAGNTTAPVNNARVPEAASGLFLIQFQGPLEQRWRAQLAEAGVDLLHYVPDDAFVARFRGVRMAQLRSWPFVHWVGPYRTEHRIHQKLQSRATGNPQSELGVTVLLAPRATPAEVAGVRNALSGVKQQSQLRSGTVLRGTVNAGQLKTLAGSDSVLWVEPAPHFKLVDEVASKIVAGDGGTKTLLTQSLGYDGSGVTVAVADSGLNNGDAATMHPDLAGRTPGFFYYGALSDAADEHSHGTHVAGIVAGNGATGETDDNGALYGLGVAPGANIIAQRIFDADGNFEAPANGFPQLTSDATGAGAVIGSDSWGDDVQGAYDVSAMEFDELVRDATGAGTNDRPYILEFSAGNAGPGPETIDSPASAKNVIATGASENDREDLFIYADGPDVIADFSSRGPCADGRIKPDVVAPGTWISSLQSESASDQYAWLPIDSLYQYQGGTSQAGPHASGAAAVFVQFYRQTHTNATPSPALVKAALINSATELDPFSGNGPVPNMDEGWGRIDLSSIVDSDLTFRYVDQSTMLTNGQVFEYRTLVAGHSEPLKITLAYTDVPGFPGALTALVNDLDLEVIAPDGQTYRGNQFDGNGESIANPSLRDTINNVEGVFLSEPIPGEYIIRIRARNVVQDVFGASGSPRQDFALVLSGIAPEPGIGELFLDRGRYTAPSQIRITLLDTDQAGHPSETVRVVSTTEPTGEAIVLNAASTSGVFTGAIATATGPTAADGRLQIANNDSIQVIYTDASASTNREATAVADLVPPVVSTPGAANSFGQEIVTWSSDEPATSIIRYGTNATLAGLNLAVTNSELVTFHSIVLDGLAVGKTYYYYVVSADEAGNTATNSANGAFFTFVPPTTATVLVVDEYGEDPLSGTTPSLSGYTDALDAIGVSYDVWDVSALGPATNVLKSYRTVMWRLPEIQGAWSPAEQTAISNYLHTGGSLFVASMQVLSRLEIDAGATNFIHNVLQVDSFVPDPDSTGAAEIIGSPNETIGNGIDIAMDYSMYSDLWALAIPLFLPDPPDISETMTPSTNATAVLRNDAGDVVGLRWPAIGKRAPGRLVLFTFPLDAAPLDNGVNDRINLLRNAIAFLAPGAAGLATVSLDAPAYSLPSLVTVDVADTNIAGAGTLIVNASSTTQTNGIPVTLTELQNSGEFIGSFAVVSISPPPAGQLGARNGDTVRVDYFNKLVNKYVTASASIDTVPATVANISAVPGYVDAEISWDTSEPTDALVQFGESALFDRTAYSANLVTSHRVTLSGLSVNRSYYYQVTSRDAAGNTTVDNNHGKFYTFRTLLPISPPWSDNMDTGGTNWGVYSDPDSECAWSLGVPNNGQASSAHSPPDAWGSNLGGGVLSLGSTFLISPAILLPGGANASLEFWHSYDFTESSDFDFYEYGELLLITNSASTAPIILSDYTNDFTDGWQKETLDLSAYAGQLIYLVWDYELASFDTRVRPGWLIDDVSIITSNAPAALELTVTPPTNSVVSLRWPDNPSLKYLILTSTNLVDWVPYSTNWLSTNEFNVPLSSRNQHTFFRLEGSPGP